MTLEALLAYGHVRRAWVGVEVGEMSHKQYTKDVSGSRTRYT